MGVPPKASDVRRRSAIAVHLAGFRQMPDLARLQVGLGAVELPLGIGWLQLVRRTAALAGALADDPPAEELGRGHCFALAAARMAAPLYRALRCQSRLC